MREMPAWRKFEIIEDMTRMMKDSIMAGLRLRYPMRPQTSCDADWQMHGWVPSWQRKPHGPPVRRLRSRDRSVASYSACPSPSSPGMTGASHFAVSLAIT